MQKTDTLTAQNSAEGGARTHVKTRGEQHFDWVTYRNVGYYANVGISLIAVYWVERMKSGQKFMASLVKGMEALRIPNEKGWATYLAQKSFFLTGGFAVIPFMKWLEDRKVDLVKKYNREMYYGAKADTDPVIIQSEKELEAAPKQNWSSVISSRFLALIPFYFAYSALWSHDSWLARNTGFYIDKPIVWMSRKLGKLSASLFGGKQAVAEITALEKASPGVMQSVWKPGADSMHSTGPYYFISEAITSAIVAVGVYLLTRVLGPIVGTKTPSHVKPAVPTPIARTSITLEPDIVEAPQSQEKPRTKVVDITKETLSAQILAQDKPVARSAAGS